MKIFLGFSFRDADRDIVRWCERQFASQFAHPVTGERLGGEALTPAVQARIDECDAVVGLLTRRDAKADGKYTTHDWVRDEINYARNKGKPAIAMVETDVDVGGMYQSHEIIAFDRASPLEAFLRLAETIGEWKLRMGRKVKVRINPDELGRKLKSVGDDARCSHRLWSKGERTAWTAVTPVPEGDGVYVWVEGVKDDDQIQLRIEGLGKKAWQSNAESQWIGIPLKNGGRS
jgi:hypothetical protein